MTIAELVGLLNLEIDKASALYGEISDNEKVKELIVGLVTIRRRTNLEGIQTATVSRSLLVNLFWTFINLDEPALEQLDRDAAAIIWPPAIYPQYASHTISWILGQEEKAGNPTATKICDLLSVFLGPDHCVNAVSLK